MREYSVQYLLDYDWFRVTAVYDTLEGALYHANQLLIQGRIIRLIAREDEGMWHTIKDKVLNQAMPGVK